ncbi:hypothetical protein PG995_015996 [Apiospora arundinis]
MSSAFIPTINLPSFPLNYQSQARRRNQNVTQLAAFIRCPLSFGFRPRTYHNAAVLQVADFSYYGPGYAELCRQREQRDEARRSEASQVAESSTDAERGPMTNDGIISAIFGTRPRDTSSNEQSTTNKSVAEETPTNQPAADQSTITQTNRKDTTAEQSNPEVTATEQSEEANHKETAEQSKQGNPEDASDEESDVDYVTRKRRGAPNARTRRLWDDITLSKEPKGKDKASSGPNVQIDGEADEMAKEDSEQSREESLASWLAIARIAYLLELQKPARLPPALLFAA